MAAIVLSGILLPGVAHAYWRGGVFFGFPPVIVGPPAYYYPPPVVYAPPPVVYDPSPPGVYGPSTSGTSCNAGAYVCPLDQPAPPGAACSCPANAGRIGGVVR